jgi:anti-sigma regulatory factor (Ser/Thr protein kinase)
MVSIHTDGFHIEGERSATESISVTLRSQRFDDNPRSAQLARAYVRSVMVGCPVDAVDKVVLMTSELVTNAVTHAGSSVVVAIQFLAESMRVEVHDESEKLPELVPISEREHHGRGIAIVDELSDEWGVLEATRGKIVWFVLNQYGESAK